MTLELLGFLQQVRSHLTHQTELQHRNLDPNLARFRQRALAARVQNHHLPPRRPPAKIAHQIRQHRPLLQKLQVAAHGQHLKVPPRNRRSRSPTRLGVLPDFVRLPVVHRQAPTES